MKSADTGEIFTGIVEYSSAITLSSIVILSPFEKRNKFLSLYDFFPYDLKDFIIHTKLKVFFRPPEGKGFIFIFREFIQLNFHC